MTWVEGFQWFFCCCCTFRCVSFRSKWHFFFAIAHLITAELNVIVKTKRTGRVKTPVLKSPSCTLSTWLPRKGSLVAAARWCGSIQRGDSSSRFFWIVFVLDGKVLVCFQSLTLNCFTLELCDPPSIPITLNSTLSWQLPAVTLLYLFFLVDFLFIYLLIQRINKTSAWNHTFQYLKKLCTTCSKDYGHMTTVKGHVNTYSCLESVAHWVFKWSEPCCSNQVLDPDFFFF